MKKLPEGQMGEFTHLTGYIVLQVSQLQGGSGLGVEGARSRGLQGGKLVASLPKDSQMRGPKMLKLQLLGLAE